jgi:diguanylate cyclase (GGDEF)-like protein
VTQVHPSVREVAVLQQATQMILSSLDADTLLHHMLLVVRNYFGAPGCAVYLVDETNGELYCGAQNGYDPEETQGRISIGKDTVAGWAAFTRAPLYIPDLHVETRHRIDNANIACVLALPLLVRERALGVMEIRANTPDFFDSDAIGLLSVFAGQAAIALDNARLYSTDLRRMRQIEIINLIARTAAAANDTQQFYSMLAELISDTFEGTTVAVVLQSREGQWSVAAFAGVPEILQGRIQASRQRGILNEGFSRRALAVSNDAGSRADWPSCFPGIGSELCAPLISLGEILGAIVLGHENPNYFTAADRTIAQAAADVCATAARNVQLSDELRHITNLDSLTNLFNQRYFHAAVSQEIPRARRHQKEFGLMIADLRGFKQINSALGQNAGDDLLRRVGKALKSSLRNNDVLARYEGDRFALLLPEVGGEGLIRVLAKLQHSLQSLASPLPNSAPGIRATWASASYPHDATTELELIKLLLERLEKAKDQSSGAQA